MRATKRPANIGASARRNEVVRGRVSKNETLSTLRPPVGASMSHVETLSSVRLVRGLARGAWDDAQHAMSGSSAPAGSTVTRGETTALARERVTS